MLSSTLIVLCAAALGPRATATSVRPDPVLTIDTAIVAQLSLSNRTLDELDAEGSVSTIIETLFDFVIPGHSLQDVHRIGQTARVFDQLVRDGHTGYEINEMENSSSCRNVSIVTTVGDRPRSAIWCMAQAGDGDGASGDGDGTECAGCWMTASIEFARGGGLRGALPSRRFPNGRHKFIGGRGKFNSGRQDQNRGNGGRDVGGRGGHRHSSSGSRDVGGRNNHRNSYDIFEFEIDGQRSHAEGSGSGSGAIAGKHGGKKHGGKKHGGKKHGGTRGGKQGGGTQGGHGKKGSKQGGGKSGGKHDGGKSGGKHGGKHGGDTRSSISEGSTSGSPCSSTSEETYKFVMILFIVAFAVAMAGIAATCYKLGRRRSADEAPPVTSPGKAMEWDHASEPQPNTRLARKANSNC